MIAIVTWYFKDYFTFVVEEIRFLSVCDEHFYLYLFIMRGRNPEGYQSHIFQVQGTNHQLTKRCLQWQSNEQFVNAPYVVVEAVTLWVTTCVCFVKKVKVVMNLFFIWKTKVFYMYRSPSLKGFFFFPPTPCTSMGIACILVTTLILNVDAIWRCVVSFHIPAVPWLYPLGRCSQYLLNRRQGRPQSQSWYLREQKNFVPASSTNTFL